MYSGCSLGDTRCNATLSLFLSLSLYVCERVVLFGMKRYSVQLFREADMLGHLANPLKPLLSFFLLPSGTVSLQAARLFIRL